MMIATSTRNSAAERSIESFIENDGVSLRNFRSSEFSRSERRSQGAVACERKPMCGSSEKIFAKPAVKVTTEQPEQRHGRDPGVFQPMHFDEDGGCHTKRDAR